MKVRCRLFVGDNEQMVLMIELVQGRGNNRIETSYQAFKMKVFTRVRFDTLSNGLYQTILFIQFQQVIYLQSIIV